MADTDYSDYSHYNGGDLLATVVVFQILTWLSVALRTYVRAFMTKFWKLDDWLMVIAQINFTLSCSFISVGLRDGLGHHNKSLPQWREILAIKWQALATATYISNMMFVKLSIGVFLLRLSTQRRYKWIIWVSMGVIAAMSSALFLWNLFQCTPVEAQWDYTIPGMRCVGADQVVKAAYALSALSIVSDFLYAFLPIPMLWTAKMTPQAKATVSVVLSLGIFASVATLVRLKSLADLMDTADILYAGTTPMVWTLIEPGVAIIAASLVTIRPLLRKLRFKGFESSQHSRSSPGGILKRYYNKSWSDRYGKKASGKRSRATSDLDIIGGRSVQLNDLESGYTGGAATADEKKVTICSSSTGGYGGFPSRDTTLISHDSSRDKELGSSQDREFGSSPVRNFSAPLRISAVPAGLSTRDDVAAALRISAVPAGLSTRDDVAAALPHDRQSDAWYDDGEDSPGLEYPQPPPATWHGTLQNGKTMWRNSMPSSVEEADVIQGLRDASTRIPGRSPFS